MKDYQIEWLREQVLRCEKLNDGSFVAWCPDYETFRAVNQVPMEPRDPDRTGDSDYVAMFVYGGHVDLCGVDAKDFKIVKSFMK